MRYRYRTTHVRHSQTEMKTRLMNAVGWCVSISVQTIITLPQLSSVLSVHGISKYSKTTQGSDQRKHLHLHGRLLIKNSKRLRMPASDVMTHLSPPGKVQACSWQCSMQLYVYGVQPPSAISKNNEHHEHGETPKQGTSLPVHTHTRQNGSTLL